MRALEWLKEVREWLKILYDYRGILLILLSGVGLFAQHQHSSAEIKDTQEKANESISALVSHYTPEAPKTDPGIKDCACDFTQINKRLDRLEREHY